MSLTPEAHRDPASRMTAYALAAGVPLACYLATASAHGYWFDGGEFVAAAAHVGISHPPGHPLATLVGATALLFPVGSMALRVALASAVCAAVASAFLFRSIETTIRAVGTKSDKLVVPLALGGTWLVAGSYGWWFQAVRPEVYALQAALIFIAIDRVLTLEARWPTMDIRPLYVASLCLGLALANHHFLAFITLPALAPTLARVRRAKGTRPLFISLGFLVLGLSTYILLPLRAAAGAGLNLGNPSSWSRFIWVVSAEAFQGNTGDGVPQPLAERFMDIAVQLVENLHWWPLLMALLGFYVLMRTPGARRLGYVWAAVLIVFVAARGWLGFVRSNPDALGYLMPALGAIGALSGALVASVLNFVGQGRSDTPRVMAVAVALLLAGLGLAQFRYSFDRASLSGFAATDTFDEVDRRSLPARAVVFTYAPQTVFRHFGGTATEVTRPDVTFVPVPLLTYPDMVTSLVERNPSLEPSLRSYLLNGQLDVGELQSLAATRPVLIELDVRIPQSMYRTLVPHGAYFRVLTDSAYEEDRRPGRLTQEKAALNLLRFLGAESEEPETRNHLLWRDYMASLYYAGVGDYEGARTSIDRGLALNPHAIELRALSEAIEQVEADEDGLGPPLDVTPFLPY